MKLDPTIAVLLGTLIGAISGIAGTVISTMIIQKSQERRQLREIVLSTALENWRHYRDSAKRAAEQGQRAILYPMESFIAPMAKVIEMCDEKDLSPDTVKRILTESAAIRDAAIEAIHDTARNKKNEEA